jgi:molybdate transport system permease protein
MPNDMIGSALKLSLIVVSTSTPVIAALGIAFGYLLAKHDFGGKELLDALLTLPMVLPPTVTGYYLILLVGRRGLIGRPVYELTGWTVTFTWMAAVIASTIIALPLMVRSARAAIESVDPRFEIASLTLGKSRLATFFHIILPLAQRGIWAGVILSFARAFGEFGATLMLAGNIPGRTQTMPLAIYEAVISGEDTQAKWLALILTGISVIIVYITNHLTQVRKNS